jgi:hypothetical protein
MLINFFWTVRMLRLTVSMLNYSIVAELCLSRCLSVLCFTTLWNSVFFSSTACMLNNWSWIVLVLSWMYSPKLSSLCWTFLVLRLTVLCVSVEMYCFYDDQLLLNCPRVEIDSFYIELLLLSRFSVEIDVPTLIFRYWTVSCRDGLSLCRITVVELFFCRGGLLLCWTTVVEVCRIALF